MAEGASPTDHAHLEAEVITDALPTAHGFHEFWGYLYHLDAMQGVSFPDINKTQAFTPETSR